jgi:hypothetical protein
LSGWGSEARAAALDWPVAATVRRSRRLAAELAHGNPRSGCLLLLGFLCGYIALQLALKLNFALELQNRRNAVIAPFWAAQSYSHKTPL